ncbi:MAG: hypothetical protein SF123_13295 [Chloroflexota bacterium]|nr:hypothetical protein [Chloroflexota bacterium]
MQRSLFKWLLAAFTVMAIASALSIVALAQDDTEPGGLGDDVEPAPPSIGADIPLTYFGPAPSSVQKELIGPYQLVTAGTIDQDAGTITMPLYRGQMTTGESVWYVITDTNDEANAAALGLNFSSKLSYADVGNAVRPATLGEDFVVTFERGTVDFSPEHSITPGEAPNYFPPAAFQPGAVGDADYSPLMRLANAGGYIYNAPIVAFNVDADTLNAFCEGNADHSITHDKVVRICPSAGTVTLEMTLGFSFARPVWYLSMDASVDLAAAMEVVTLAPALTAIPLGADDSFSSAVERIFPVVNGPMGIENPQRQGFNSALAGEGGPLNTLGGIPTIATDYSPLWDLNPVVWTEEAIANGYRSRVTEEFFILGLVQRGWLTGLGGGAFGSVGIIVNCPVMFRFL